MRASLEGLEKPDLQAEHHHRVPRWLIPVGGLLSLIILSSAVYLVRAWPFTQANIIKELEQATSSHVQVHAFHRTFFPHLGCIAEGIEFSRGATPQNQAVMTVEKLTIVGDFPGLFAKHVALIQAEHAKAMFPPIGTGEAWRPTASKVVVDKLTADGAVLEFTLHDESKPPLRFAIHKFVAQHLALHDPMKFDVQLQNPKPPGAITASGSFGPWNLNQVGATPIEGTYSFRDADLGAFAGIAGLLSSQGHYHGTLESIDVEGIATTPDFKVRGSSHKVPLASDFQAQVNALGGDVKLHKVVARVLRTAVFSRGSIEDNANKPGKTTALDLAVQNGRIQDLLLMFVSEKQAPVNGSVSLKANAVIPPGSRPFLEKLQMTGDFGVESALFTKPETQANLDKLSTASRGQPEHADDPNDVVSDLRGHVIVKGGIATFSQLSFHVPGAAAKLNGTFDLRTEAINLKGALFMEAKLPKATTGVKSFLLKAIDPFLKKNRRGGATIPVTITGTYQHPIYRSDPV